MIRCLLPLLALLAGCSSVETSIEIHAPASAVRAVVFDYAEYPQWNPYLVKLDGTVAKGNNIYVTVDPVGGHEIIGTAKIISVTENKMSLAGMGMSQVESGPVMLPVPGILGAKHDLIVEEVAPDRTIFHNNVRYSGADIPFIDLKPMEAGLLKMNEALKKRVEGGEGTHEK
jgi:hypothetical protein